MLAFVLAAAWLIAQALVLPLLAGAVTVAALWAAGAAAPGRADERLHLALAAITLPLLAGFLLLLGPCRSGLSALLVQAGMVAVLAPLAPLLYAWTFSGRHGPRRP